MDGKSREQAEQGRQGGAAARGGSCEVAGTRSGSCTVSRILAPCMQHLLRQSRDHNLDRSIQEPIIQPINVDMLLIEQKSVGATTAVAAAVHVGSY